MSQVDRQPNLDGDPWDLAKKADALGPGVREVIGWRTERVGPGTDNLARSINALILNTPKWQEDLLRMQQERLAQVQNQKVVHTGSDLSTEYTQVQRDDFQNRARDAVNAADPTLADDTAMAAEVSGVDQTANPDGLAPRSTLSDTQHYQDMQKLAQAYEAQQRANEMAGAQ